MGSGSEDLDTNDLKVHLSVAHQGRSGSVQIDGKVEWDDGGDFIYD